MQTEAFRVVLSPSVLTVHLSGNRQLLQVRWRQLAVLPEFQCQEECVWAAPHHPLGGGGGKGDRNWYSVSIDVGMRF